MTKPLKDEYRLLVQSYIDNPITGRDIKQLREQGRIHEASCAWAALALRGQRDILTTRQAKLDLAEAKDTGYINVGLTLAPAGEAAWAFEGRFTACTDATPGCMRSCVGNRGQGRSTNDGGWADHGYVARCGRTIAWAFDPARFEQLLVDEVRRKEYDAAYAGAELAFRGDVASDYQTLSALIASETTATAYGYTKRSETLDWDDGVARILSRSERNDAEVMEALGHGHSVAVVFDAKKGELPSQWRGYPVIDGDVHDLWFLRINGPTVVGLSLKGRRLEKAIARSTGFAVQAISAGAKEVAA